MAIYREYKIDLVKIRYKTTRQIELVKMLGSCVAIYYGIGKNWIKSKKCSSKQIQALYPILSLHQINSVCILIIIVIERTWKEHFLIGTNIMTLLSNIYYKYSITSILI